ncbi:hypothetical protein DL95DRAFT_400768 [Leptodontidium sp. 2 PMI_412]|nr:hypothetical protein DL95DRAFT_400768 [Leptodontidium sp. 2 PMI_412]
MSNQPSNKPLPPGVQPSSPNHETPGILREASDKASTTCLGGIPSPSEVPNGPTPLPDRVAVRKQEVSIRFIGVQGPEDAVRILLELPHGQRESEAVTLIRESLAEGSDGLVDEHEQGDNVEGAQRPRILSGNGETSAGPASKAHIKDDLNTSLEAVGGGDDRHPSNPRTTYVGDLNGGDQNVVSISVGLPTSKDSSSHPNNVQNVDSLSITEVSMPLYDPSANRPLPHGEAIILNPSRRGPCLSQIITTERCCTGNPPCSRCRPSGMTAAERHYVGSVNGDGDEDRIRGKDRCRWSGCSCICS